MTALAEPRQDTPARPAKFRPVSVPDTGFLPRIAPPRPGRSDIADLRKAARLVGRPLYGWQDLAGQYMTATYRGRWKYPELAIVVARQNGKTSLLLPRIVMGLLKGERIMMTAQDRQLIVRDVFNEVSDVMEDHFKADMKEKPRRANGQESVTMRNGGRFRIVAPTRGGARGPSNDLVILDEAREMRDHDFVAAAQPTLTVSPNPQFIFLSNAGVAESIVLNALRKRAAEDASLGYVEWSADAERPTDDRTGWMEANPSLGGGINAKSHWIYLERMHMKYTLEGTMGIFQTEHLCQWVDTELPRVVSVVAWEKARQAIGQPRRPVMAIAQDPAGRRVSVALAWKGETGVEGYVLADLDGYPVDTAAAAEKVQPLMRQLGVRSVAFHPWTDREFARHFKDAKPMQPGDWEAACRTFAETVDSGNLHYQDDDGRLTMDMGRTVRQDTAHGWIAIGATDTEPTTASLALIRAVWLATMPAPSTPRVY